MDRLSESHGWRLINRTEPNGAERRRIDVHRNGPPWIIWYDFRWGQVPLWTPCMQNSSSHKKRQILDRLIRELTQFMCEYFIREQTRLDANAFHLRTKRNLVSNYTIHKQNANARWGISLGNIRRSNACNFQNVWSYDNSGMKPRADHARMY